jgi:hypothetical protein
VELADIGRAAVDQAADNDELRQRVDRETVATLQQAFDNGYQDPHDRALTFDQRFTHLHDNRQFADLIAKHSY